MAIGIKSSIQNKASGTFSEQAVSGDITVAGGFIYYVDTSAARQLSLPASIDGIDFFVKDISGLCNTNNITIVKNTGQSIEGIALNKTLQTDWGGWHFRGTGVNLYML